ncbi:MAG: hypothetical protein MSH39_10235 [[Actinobacillus] rossii]|nr:hypothetical protein [[Actinobacillus] rossii]
MVNGSAQKTIKGMSRYAVKFQCPASGCVSLRFRCSGTTTGANPNVYVARPMLEECTQYTTQPSAWVNSGVTAIHGGSIVTNTITAQQIAANTITANEIASGAIATRHLSANSVNAGHIVSKSLTADKLNISSLSAISANLGSVTAGSISGTTISGGTITGTTINGGTISGTTINGGTIKSANFEGATGTFSGTLKVNQLLGGGVIEHIVLSKNFSSSTNSSGKYIFYYNFTVKIHAINSRRIIMFKKTFKRNRYFFEMIDDNSEQEESIILNAGESKTFSTTYIMSSTESDANTYGQGTLVVLAYMLSENNTITIS